MTKETLLEALKRAPSVEGSKGSFRVAEDHNATFYLGLPGQAMVVANVTAIELGETTIELRAKEMGHVLAGYEAVFAVTVRPPKEPSAKRAGFG